jgi:hypothetical protein
MLVAAAFTDRLFNFFPRLAGAFLNATDQFVFLAFGELQIVIRKLRKFLFQLALGNVPVSFGCKSAHIILVVMFLHASGAGDISSARGVPSVRFLKTKDLAHKKNSLLVMVRKKSLKKLQFAHSWFLSFANCIF